MTQMKSNDNLMEEYKEYISSLMNSGFNFETWCQHQYGKIPKGMKVQPRLEFDISTQNNDK